MNYGLYLSASGVLTNMHRQDVIANNLANASTTGFKKDLVGFAKREPEVVENALNSGEVANALLDRLSGGGLVSRSQIDLSTGALTKTDNKLDLALVGQGFFVLNDPNDSSGDGLYLSRDGRMSIDSETGALVVGSAGYEVLDINNKPIYLDAELASDVEVDQAGNIRQGGDVIGTIQIAGIGNPQRMRHMGEGLYKAGDIASRKPGDAIVKQKYLEESNVNPIKEMVQLIQASRSIDFNSTLISYHDQILNKAVNVLGRVS